MPSSATLYRHRHHEIVELSLHARLVLPRSRRKAARAGSGQTGSRRAPGAAASVRNTAARHVADSPLPCCPAGCRRWLARRPTSTAMPAGPTVFVWSNSLYPAADPVRIAAVPERALRRRRGAAVLVVPRRDRRRQQLRDERGGQRLAHRLCRDDDGGWRARDAGRAAAVEQRRRRRARAGDRSHRDRRRDRSAVDCLHAGGGERGRDRSGRRHRGAVDLRPAVRVHRRRTGRGSAHPRDLVRPERLPRLQARRAPGRGRPERGSTGVRGRCRQAPTLSHWSLATRAARSAPAP